jgi:selenide,water dikinase
MVAFDPSVPQYLQDIFYDPQTSGGLLIAVSKAKAPRLQAKLRSSGIEAPVIGRVVAEHKGKIRVL